MATWKGTNDADYHRGTGDADRFDGGAGNDALDGGGGHDTLIGGDGNDYLSDFTAGADATLLGGSGSDTIGACVGNDYIDGGTGNDWLILALNANSVVIDLQKQIALSDGFGGVDTLKSIENILYGVAYADSITGSDKANELPVGDRDKVWGGGGDDILHIAGINAGAATGGDGIDTADFSGFYYASSGEQISPDHGIHVALADSKVLDDGYGGTGILKNVENVAGGIFNDRITGSRVDNLLSGSWGSDRLSGLDGDDTLVGGIGKDSFRGGAGADRFRFEYSDESGSTGKSADVILDFSHAQGDKIDLRAIDANPYTPTNEGFHFIGHHAFDSSPGEVRYRFSHGDTYVELTTAEYGTDMVIKIEGIHDLVKSDFII